MFFRREAKRCEAGLSVVSAACLALLSIGCGDSGGQTDVYAGSCPAGTNCSIQGVSLVFKTDPAQADFFERPWPSDVRLTGDGTIDLDGFPNPGQSSLLSEWVSIAQRTTRGFGENAAVYFSFNGPLDADSLPTDPAATIADDSPVFIIDLSDSPDRGKRTPLSVRYFDERRQFTPKHTLVMRPLEGFPLRSGARYAAVVTRGVRGGSGRPLGATSDFERTKYATPPDDVNLRAWWDMLNSTYAELEQFGVQRADVAALTVYTTQPVVTEMDRIRDFVAGRPVPDINNWKLLSERTDCYLFEGWFDLPQYQAGDPPDFDGGGGFVFGSDDQPIVQRTENVAFSLAVPRGSTPAGGWPLVMYHHGTGGDRFSFCNSSTDVCDLLADKGIASIAISQPLHGERNPWGRDETEITFNINNVEAFRDNFRQGAADLLVLRRLITNLAVPAAVAPGGQDVPFDNDKVGFMGHSQGGITGPIYLGTDLDVKGAVLSASGGGLNIVLLQRKDPVDIRALLVTVMNIEDSEFDLDHPVVNLFQTFAERADPINYTRRLIAEPPAGAPAKHLFYSEGLHDSETMPEQEENMAASSGCALMTPYVREFESMQLRGVEPVDPPVSGNTQGPDNQKVTAVLVQYPDDGHFAVFDNANAIRHYTGFLDTLMHADLPSVGP